MKIFQYKVLLLTSLRKETNNMDILSTLSLIHWLILIVISAVTGIIAAVSYFKLFYKREKIINNNLKRPIKIFFPPGNATKNMEMEYNLLSKSGLFNVEKPTSDFRDTVRISNHSLVILGCDEKMENFDSIFDKSAAQKIPILIYTFGDNKALQPKHWEKLNTYPYYSVCNTPLRLTSDVFTMLSTFPNEK